MRRFFQDHTVRFGFWFIFHIFLFITGISGFIILLAHPTGKLGGLAFLSAAAVFFLLRRHSSWPISLSTHVAALAGFSTIVLNNHPGYLAVMALMVMLTQVFALPSSTPADEAPYAVTGRTNHLSAALDRVRSLRD